MTETNDPPKIGRKTFLAAAAALIGAPAILAVTQVAPRIKIGETPIPEIKDAEVIKGEIEAGNVTINSVHTDKAFSETEIEGWKSTFPDFETSWDKERLLMLQEFLGKVPTSFLKPLNENGKLKFTLVPPVNGSLGANSVYYLGSDSIYINYKTFVPEAKEESFMDLVDILAQRFISGKNIIIDNKVNQLIENDFNKECVRLRKLLEPELPAIKAQEEQIGRSSHANLADQLIRDSTPSSNRQRYLDGYMRSFAAAKHPISSLGLSESEGETVLVNLKFLEPINTENPHIFMGRLAGVYTLGQDKFERQIGRFFDNKVTKNLYAYLRYEVFDGRTYDKAA